MYLSRTVLKMRFFSSLLTYFLLGLPFAAESQEAVNFSATSAGNTLSGNSRVDATFTKVASTIHGAKLPAVILLHSAWGWADEHEGFSDYAKAFQKAGFATLEVHMFPRPGSAKSGGPAAYLPELFGALNFMSERPDIDPGRIGVAGFSFGGLLALVSATSWATKTYAIGGQRFKAHAPFYPICWVMKANVVSLPLFNVSHN